MGPRVLVVDDEAGVCWALEKALLPSGFEVTTIGTGGEALRLLSESVYEVAFLDAVLPDTDGLELASDVGDLAGDTSLVLISGYLHLEDRSVQSALASGLIIGFIAKPFLLDEVREMARRGVELNRQRREAARI